MAGKPESASVSFEVFQLSLPFAVAIQFGFHLVQRARELGSEQLVQIPPQGFAPGPSEQAFGPAGPDQDSPVQIPYDRLSEVERVKQLVERTAGNRLAFQPNGWGGMGLTLARVCFFRVVRN